jgi:hypothetical protein
MSLAAVALSAMLAVDHPVASAHETADEAMFRWSRIASALARVANDPPREWRWLDAMGRLQLVRAEVTIGKHESNFTWAVHAGVKRGGHSVCLTQVEPREARKLGYDPESLVGTDDEATERCFRASVTILANMRELAEHRCSSARHWFAPAVAAYGSGRGCVPEGEWAKGVAARERTYERTGMRKALPASVAAMLEDPT